MRRLLLWLPAVALGELTTRALVYGLAPPTANLDQLSGELGGPGPVLVGAVAITLSLVLSAGVLALAAIGARERWALSDPVAGSEGPRLPLARVGRRWGVLWLVGLLVFTCIESCIHLRAGLGFHGLHCLTGPVHVNAIPVSAAVSLLVAAAVTAAGHLLRWMRRVVERLVGRRPRRRIARRALLRPRPFELPSRAAVLAALRARPPPLALGI
ncbi:MAG: hypothetical protein ACJ766_00120 [Thermoleophilaceae bacterium]